MKRSKMKDLTPEQIQDGMQKVIVNALELLADAEILLYAGRYPRAYTLAHLTSEEVAKLNTLTSIWVKQRRGEEIDWNWVNKSFTNHTPKIVLRLLSQYAYSLLDPNYSPSSFEEEDIASLNELKNKSLYVDYEDGKFIAPSEVITEELARSTVEEVRALLRKAVPDQAGILDLIKRLSDE